MLYADPARDRYDLWRRGPPPRMLLIETVAGHGSRTRLRRLVGSDDEVAWLRPDPSGAGAASTSLLRGIRRNHPGDSSPMDAAHRAAPLAGVDAAWPDIWKLWSEAVSGAPARVWVVDDAHRLPAAGWDALLETWAAIRGQALPVHLVLAGTGGIVERVQDLPHDHLRLEPLPAAAWLTRDVPWRPDDRVRAAGVFGRSAVFHEYVDPGRSLAANVRSLLLQPRAPFLTRTIDAVLADLQRPERYLRAIASLARGDREWGHVRDAVGDLSSSGQLGPYMKTLEELGMVVGERSLDAHPRTRSRRWRLTDPHTGFWFGAVLPLWDRLGVHEASDLWDAVEPELDAHTARILPILVREWLGTPRAAELLGSSAREVGGLWGDGYDIDVAGTLRNGAIVYAWTRWTGGPFTPAEIEACLEQLRHTRYGFGRERRLKLFVQRDPPDHALARVDARDPEVVVVGVDGLVTGSGSSSRTRA